MAVLFIGDVPQWIYDAMRRRKERGKVMAEPTFYRCNKCGTMVALLKKGSCDPSCCGEPMEILVAGSVDAAVEKHVPVITEAEDGKHILVKVGVVEHPSIEEHYIEWIALAAEDKLFVRYLKPGDKPEAKFGKCCSKGATVYAYCNLHGLWKAEVEL
ncbi:putative superoxide reductase [Atopobium sp. oral taxon 810 str. F0209]|nr:putative superoxide reductase [Atopobium sp. oral taxon 810 str. F0209]